MNQQDKDQIINLINKSQKVLLLTHAKADCDGLGSMISMYLALKALGKDVVAATNDPAPDALSFLPSINIVQNSISSNNFVIQLDISKTPLSKIKYKMNDDHSKVNIVITPKEGVFSPEDVSFEKDGAAFDLIITFDTGNLEHLGPIYDRNAEMFFSTPLINIDHHASNTDYGQVNYVDMVAASTTEVLLELLQDMEKHFEKTFINEDVATLLLAGLITDTGSFQHANTSPRAMEVAAKLLDYGARQQEIIKNIYKTKKLSTLKLWGTVLSKVETDPIHRLVWSSISQNDLKETGASAEESEGIIDELLSNAPGAEIIMLFKYHEEGYTSVSMRSTTNSADVGKIATEMGGGGHIRAAGFKRREDINLEKLISETLEKTRNYQAERLNIHPESIVPPNNTQPKESLKPVPENKPQALPVSTNAIPENKEKTVQYLDFNDERKPEEKLDSEKKVSEKDQSETRLETTQEEPVRNENTEEKAPKNEEQQAAPEEKNEVDLSQAEDDHQSEEIPPAPKEENNNQQ